MTVTLRIGDREIVAERTGLREEVTALRRSAILTDLSHMAVVRVAGPDAYDALDPIVAADLHIRDGRVRHTLFLAPNGAPIADVYLCNDDGDFLLVAEGMASGALVEHVRAHAPTNARDFACEDLSTTHRILSVDGPFAWEVVAAALGSELAGLPYLSFCRVAGAHTCIRAGKTGEYGYHLIAREELAADLEGRLLEVGRRMDLVQAGIATSWHAAVENGLFNIHRHAVEGATPVELQLQWRVSHKKKYLGSDVVVERQRAPRERLTWLIGEAPLAAFAEVRFEGERVGRVIEALDSVTLGAPVACAMLDIEVAHSGLSGFEIGETRARSASAPLVDNLSMYVNPGRHSFATRAEIEFPGFVRGT